MKSKNRRWLWLGFDRLLSQSMLKQFTILVAILVVALLLSYLTLCLTGDGWEKFCSDEGLNKYLLPFYLLTDSNALNNLYMGNDGTSVKGWGLIVSSLIFLFGAFVFNGIIIGIITNCIEQRVSNHKKGHIHYLKSGHYIIMGYDDIVPSVIAYIFEKDESAYVLILSASDAEMIREKLRKTFDKKLQKHIIINYGHRTSPDYYKDIHLETAEQVFVIGNHTKSEHDAINVECMDSIYRYLNRPEITERPGQLTCVFKDLDTYAAFKTSEIFMGIRKLGIDFIPYNYYTGWAKQVFVRRKYKDSNDTDANTFPYPAVYGKGITPDDERNVHLVFVGTTNYAVAFAMEAAHVLHFPNFAKKGVKTKITFIDIHADKEKDEFITRNRHFFEIQSYTYKDLSKDKDQELQGVRDEYLTYTGTDANFLDVEFEFIKGDIFSKAVQDEIESWAKEHDDKQYLSLFLAMSEQRQNFVMAMNMPDAVYDKSVPIFIRQDRSDNFVTDLRKADQREDGKKLNHWTVNCDKQLDSKPRDARFAHIYPFGMNETAFSADDHSLKRAKLINFLYMTANYETYKFKSMLKLDAMSADDIWEEANKYWRDDEFTVALKWSNLYSAYAIRTKLATLRAMRGLDIEDTSHDYDQLTESEIEQIAIVEHNRWNVEKLLMGFCKARKEEDKYEHKQFAKELGSNKKLFIHHDIRPYDQLDVIKELDREFSRYIPWIMEMTEGTKS